MTKKKARKKKAGKITTPKEQKVTLEDLNKRLIRIEKLILLIMDESYLHERERARVTEIERLVKRGEFDKLADVDLSTKL
ncbi:MAG: hypothetical protein ACXAC2_09435 [Candidatus Kariarchaeaceae archaeon]|jgi:hypothetical protein